MEVPERFLRQENPSPPSKEAVEENRSRLARMEEMEKRGVRESDIPQLMRFLDPIVPFPPPEIKRLPEGYAQAKAADLLEGLGEAAHPQLLTAVKEGHCRVAAFDILAGQGCKQVFDEAFSLPDAGELGSRMVLYLPWRGPIDPPAMRAWYQANRHRLVFDKATRRFNLLTVQKPM